MILEQERYSGGRQDYTMCNLLPLWDIYSCGSKYVPSVTGISYGTVMLNTLTPCWLGDVHCHRMVVLE